MLASILSCSTSFLACAMLAVLLLAIGVLDRSFRNTRKENKKKIVSANSWASKCASSSQLGDLKAVAVARPGFSSPLHPWSVLPQIGRQTRGWGFIFQLSLLPHPFFRGGKKKNHTHTQRIWPNVLPMGSNPILLVNCDQLSILYYRDTIVGGLAFQCHLIQHCCK